jgi:hypothetical protein
LIDEERWRERSRAATWPARRATCSRSSRTRNPRLLALPTFLGTPHIGAAPQEAQLAMGRAPSTGLESARVPGDGWPA